MQGIFIKRLDPPTGRVNYNRPKSKKAVKEAIADNPASVRIEATSMFGNEYDGSVADAPDGKYLFVGPDPYTKRNFYGSIVVSNGKVKVS